MSKNALPPALREMAQTSTDEAARRLGQLISSERDCVQKLALLEGYLAEYRERFEQAASKGLDPSAWRNYATFIQRIEEAITAQRGIVDQSKQRSAQGQRHWIEQRNRLKAFETLSQRQREREARESERQAQKSSDELTARRFGQPLTDD